MWGRVCVVLLALQGARALAEEGAAGFGGPNSVGAQIEADRAAQREARRFAIESYLDGYFAWKDRLKEDIGLAFGLDYNALLLTATDSPGEDTAAGGVARVFGRWELVGRNTPDRGVLVFKVEHRHRLGTDVAPARLGSEVGYVGVPATGFSAADWLLTNLYWVQALLSGRLILIGGIVDVTDYVHTYGLVSPWADFGNLGFGSDASIPAPGQGLGFAVLARFGGHLYAHGGIADANGDPTEPGDVFESFFDTAEYFTHFEFGWIESWEKRFTDNVHVALWHGDARTQIGAPSGWGAAFSWNRTLACGCRPFVRVGYADDGGAFWEYSASVGVGYAFTPRSFAAAGLNWSRPTADTPGRDDQFTLEAYWRIRATKVVTLIPTFQLLVQPASNPDNDVIGLFGLRVRFGF